MRKRDNKRNWRDKKDVIERFVFDEIEKVRENIFNWNGDSFYGSNERGREYIKRLHPGYVKKLLEDSIGTKNIPSEIILIKTKQIKLKRHVKQKTPK